MNEPYHILFEVIKDVVLDSSDVALDDVMFVAGVTCAGMQPPYLPNNIRSTSILQVRWCYHVFLVYFLHLNLLKLWKISCKPTVFESIDFTVCQSSPHAQALLFDGMELWHSCTLVVLISYSYSYLSKLIIDAADCDMTADMTFSKISQC